MPHGARVPANWQFRARAIATGARFLFRRNSGRGGGS